MQERQTWLGALRVVLEASQSSERTDEDGDYKQSLGPQNDL